RIGLPVRLASARPSLSRVNHWMPLATAASFPVVAGATAARETAGAPSARNAAAAAARDISRLMIVLLRAPPVGSRSPRSGATHSTVTPGIEDLMKALSFARAAAAPV